MGEAGLHTLQLQITACTLTSVKGSGHKNHLKVVLGLIPVETVNRACRQSKYCNCRDSVLTTALLSTLHSSKILTIQQGQPRGVSSIGNPRQASTGFNSESLISYKVCKGLTKC